MACFTRSCLHEGALPLFLPRVTLFPIHFDEVCSRLCEAYGMESLMRSLWYGIAKAKLMDRMFTHFYHPAF